MAKHTMAKDNGIDFDEPMVEMIARLKARHKKFESNLARVKTSIKDNNITMASETVRGTSDKVLHHAVEEEARLVCE